MSEILQRSFLGNPVSSWLLALAIFLAVLAILLLLRQLVRKRLRRLVRTTATAVDDVLISVLNSTKPFFLVLFAAWAGSRSLEIAVSFNGFVVSITIIVVLAQIGIWASTALTKWLAIVREKKAGEGEALTWITGIEWMGRVVIWSVLVLIGLENLGVDVTGLATGLGIGGVAVALAVRSILSDLFSAFSIYIDQPFVLGDYLRIGEFEGTVENIGLKTTRMRSLTGEQLVFANSDLVSSRIKNYGRLVERRASFTVSVTYDTPQERLERIPAMIQEIIEAKENTRFDRSHFTEFGDSALQVTSVYWVLVPAYQVFLDIQQAINLELRAHFNAEGIEFAFPTRTIVLADDRSDDSPSETKAG